MATSAERTKPTIVLIHGACTEDKAIPAALAPLMAERADATL